MFTVCICRRYSCQECSFFVPERPATLGSEGIEAAMVGIDEAGVGGGGHLPLTRCHLTPLLACSFIRYALKTLLSLLNVDNARYLFLILDFSVDAIRGPF